MSCLCLLIVVYVFLDAATLTEVFPCFFLGCKANARVILAKTGHGPHSSNCCVVLCIVYFVLFYVLFVCKCVLPLGDNPIAVNKYIIYLSNYWIRGPTFVLPTVKYWPLWRLVTVEVVLPVADSEFLVETSVVGTDIRDATPILVTHVEDLTVVLRIGVEAHSSVRTVESECQVRKILPPLGLGTGTQEEILHIPLNGTATLRHRERWTRGLEDTEDPSERNCHYRIRKNQLDATGIDVYSH